MTARLTTVLACGGALALGAACGGEFEPLCELSRDDGEPFERLTDYCFFDGYPARHVGGEGVVPFEPTAELYADESRKQRFIVLPDGETIGFDAEDRWSWPEGTILIKTFYYPHDARDPDAGRELLETRLLIRRASEWDAETYVWNEAQTEAERHTIGARVDVEFIDREGEVREVDYRIPNRNQCADCHAQDGETVPLGPRTRQLMAPYGGDGERSQVEDLAERGLLDAEPPPAGELPSVPDPHDPAADRNDRARAYLDANCAHCHNASGRASSSNLHLDYDEDQDVRLGICKSPVAAGSASGGRDYDIVPGEPDESIFIYRMESTEPDVKMPELPITTVDEAGVALIRDWIAEMEPTGCD